MWEEPHTFPSSRKISSASSSIRIALSNSPNIRAAKPKIPNALASPSLSFASRERATPSLATFSIRRSSPEPYMQTRQGPVGSTAHLRREVGPGQRLLHPRAPLSMPGAHHPVHAQSPAEPGSCLRILRLERPTDRGSQVVVLGFEPVEPLDLIGALYPRLRPLGERRKNKACL